MNVKMKGEKGQGVVESLLVTILFLTAVIFAMVQLCMIGYGWLRANDAAQAGVRCAIVAKGATASSNEAKNAAQVWVLDFQQKPHFMMNRLEI